ncbi:DUF5958 family protein [Fibrella sp. ES10-3-2-2]|nr:hypothetical protein A6C57_22680 [Fibrella sp. ES10-3-2-2]
MDFQEILFNSYAQGINSLETCQNWFANLNSDDQRQAFQKVLFLLVQAHPSPELIHQAVVNSPIKPTMTPVVILLKNTLANAVTKLKQLPDNELFKSFTIVLFVFGQADSYRRAVHCQAGCSHEWHHFDYQNWKAV